jgi:hypothetical protein
MYVCAFCKKPSLPGEVCSEIVVRVREHEYRDHRGEPTIGRQIVATRRACPTCAPTAEATPPVVIPRPEPEPEFAPAFADS